MPTRMSMLAVLAATFTIGLFAGCSPPTTTATPTPPLSSPTAAVSTGPSPEDSASDHSLKKLCDAQPWPLPVPALTGMILDQAEIGSLFCFDNIHAHTASGDDPHNNPADVTAGNTYRITSTNPPAGTRIGHSDLLTVEVTQVNLGTEQPAFHPCDWITPDEVAAVLGVPTPGILTTGDEEGSVDRSCTYNTGDDVISSELKLDGALLIDGDTEYRWRIAKDGGDVITSLPAPAACDTAEGVQRGPNHSIYAELPDNRIYQLLGSPDTSCEQLTQLAAIALPRIGP